MNKKRTIIFYGDSNTYGYDPSDMYEFRYPYEQRWTTIIAGILGEGFATVPEGMNGRMLPDPVRDQSYLTRLVRLAGEDGLFCTMLGTNDLLVTMQQDAAEPARRMEAYIRFLEEYLDPAQILIIAPPLIGGEEPEEPLLRLFHRGNARMNRAFCRIAKEHGAGFADASEWGIGLSADRVHFSEEGHRTFAGKLAPVILQMV